MRKRESLVCVIRGCDNLGKLGGKNSTYKTGPFEGQRRRGSLCNMHTKEKIAKKKGITVSELRRENLKRTAANKGMTVREYNRHMFRKRATKHGMSPNEYANSFHPYKKYRKRYCENVDGRLGNMCTATIIDYEYQLEVDHIDDNHDNNNPNNLQTLCANCHRIKTKHHNRNDAAARMLMWETILKSRKKSENN